MNAPARAVAVVGVAFQLPQVQDWAELAEVLASGRHTVRPMPEARAKATGVVRGPADRNAGWIDDITGFDHRYFGMSRAEAELTDPRQRRALQLAVAAIGNAGYSPRELRGGRVAVYVAAHGGPRTDLYDLLPPAQAKGPAWVGSLHANAAGRIAYVLDLRGPALAVDTACSSFLVALHEARVKLALGEVDFALVGGFVLHLGSPPQRMDSGDGLGVESPTDKCRPFDHLADGASYGEGGGFVLLKRLRDAHEDGDVVHAVIRGTAVNSDGGRGNGQTAPSPHAQTEVIRAAWRDAEVTPATIGYIEAHGTGTKIGDPLEIEGLADAFADTPHPDGCQISSVKANFGHLGAMSGFAGLVSVLTRFRTATMFPTAGFTAPNPLLPLEGSPIRVAERVSRWESQDTPRRAGISSFGLSGTNAHAVVEEHVARPRPDTAGARVVVLSAPTPESLRQHVAATCRAVDHVSTDLDAVSWVSTAGREHFAYRCGWQVSDTAELVARLDEVTAGEFTEPQPVSVIFAFGSGGDQPGADQSDVDALARAHPGFLRVVEQAGPPGGAHELAVLRMIGVYEVLGDLEIRPDLVLGHGIGTATARYARGEAGVREAIGCAGDFADSAPPDRQRLTQALAAVSNPLVVDLAPDSALSSALSELLPAERIVGVDQAAGARRWFDPVLLALFLAGRTPRWEQGGGVPRRRVELPVAPHDQEPCWPGTIATESTVDSDRPVEPADVVLTVVREVLKEPGLTLQDDFLGAGGNSLIGMEVVTRLNEWFGIDLDVLDLFDSADLAALAGMVRDQSPAGPRPTAARTAQPVTAVEGPLSGQQTAIWAAGQLADDGAIYVVPGALLFDEEVDAAVLTERLGRMIDRHPMLRATLDDGPDGPVQRVRPRFDVPVTTTELDLRDVPAEALHAVLRDRLTPLACAPLDPSTGPGVRFTVVQADSADRRRTVLLLSFHHLFFDGWSWRIVFAELSGRAVSPTRTYLDHVREQRSTMDSERGGELRDFWSTYLDGAPAGIDLGFLKHDRVDHAGDSVTVTVPRRTHQELVRFSRDERVTQYMVLLAAWVTLLWRHSAQRDLPVATPVANRGPADADIVGCYVNTVLTRVRLRPDQPVRTLLAQVKASTLAALAHHELPTDALIRATRPAGDGGRPISNVMFDYQSGVEPLRRLGTDGPAVDLLDIGPPGAKFTLNLSCLDYDDRLDVRLEYTDAAARDLAAEYLAVLDRIADPDADLFQLFGEGTAPATTESVLPDFQF